MCTIHQMRELLYRLIVAAALYLCCWNGSFAFADTIPIFPSGTLSIAEGAGFLAFLNPAGGVELPPVTSAAGQWIHCSVGVDNVQYSLDSDQIHRIGEKTTVERYDPERCGIRVKNVQKSLESKWTLYGTDAHGEGRTGVLELTVLSPKLIDELNVTASGTLSSTTINCPDKDGARYCRILDAEQNVYESCTKSVELTQRLSHFWCHLMFWGAMTERITKINLHVEEDDRDVTATVDETEDHIVLSCQYRQSVSLCRALSEADNRQFLLLDGHLSGRYSAYNTKISKGICSLEIKKPLAPSDVGVWRIYQQLNPTDYTGCVFDVKSRRTSKARTFIRARGTSKAAYQRAELTATSIEIFHDPRSSSPTVTPLSCQVPYAIDYCYLSGPTGSDYAPIRFNRLKSLGLCRFEVTNITTGMWACGVNDLDGAEDQLTYYNVSVYRQPGRTVTDQLTASSGDREQRLLCRTILDLPIDICRFVDPSGEVHGLSDMMKPSAEARYRYHGKGLREGECGLEIVELREKDFGRWKCVIKVRNQEYEIGMEIVEEALSVGAIIGISIGATIALGIIGIFVYRKLNRRYTGPTYTVSSSMTNVSNGSHQS
uniref:Ig-like domain-containing protein n=1 Tax=Anopheles farauti TaxID=69004 RepID=A0A182QG43_9DIPT